MKPREGSTAQIREGQDFLGGESVAGSDLLWEEHVQPSHTFGPTFARTLVSFYCER
jgi:hypothetical protein